MLEGIKGIDNQGDRLVPIESVEVFKVIIEMNLDVLRKVEVLVRTKYKTVDKKLKSGVPANNKHFGSLQISDMLLQRRLG
jgi:hypothetical protein